MSVMAILRQLRHHSVVRGSRELPFWLASSQRYTADQDPQHQICFGNNMLRVEGEGHLSAPVESSEHPSPLSGSLKLSQPSEVLSILATTTLRRLPICLH